MRDKARGQMKQEGLIIHGEEFSFICKQGEATKRIVEAWIQGKGLGQKAS